MEDKNLKGHSAMLVANILFGLNIPLSKTVMLSGMVGSFALSYYRMAGAAVVFWLVSLFTKKEHVRPKDLLLLFVASIFAIQLNQTSFIVGLGMTSPLDTSVIVTFTPIFTMILSAIFLREPLTWKKTAGVLIGATGALILVLSSVGADRGNASIEGNLLCLLSTLSFAIYLSAFRDLIRRYSPVTIMKWMFLFSALGCGPICWREVAAVDYAALPLDIYLRIGYVIVGATFFSFLLVPVGQRYLRPTVVSMYNYVQPLVAAVVSVVLGLDYFGWKKTFAAILVFLGVYVVMKSKSRAQLEAEKRERESRTL